MSKNKVEVTELDTLLASSLHMHMYVHPHGHTLPHRHTHPHKYTPMDKPTPMNGWTPTDLYTSHGHTHPHPWTHAHTHIFNIPVGLKSRWDRWDCQPLSWACRRLRYLVVPCLEEPFPLFC